MGFKALFILLLGSKFLKDCSGLRSPDYDSISRIQYLLHYWTTEENKRALYSWKPGRTPGTNAVGKQTYNDARMLEEGRARKNTAQLETRKDT